MTTPASDARTAFERELLDSIEAVHRFAVRLTQDRDRADDLVQETYVRALAHRDQFTPGTNCRAWLFKICRNAFLKNAGRETREVAAGDPELEALAAAAIHGTVAQRDPVGALFERVEVDEAVQRALARLAEEFRAVVILVDLEDQSYATVAEILDIPIGTVRSRLFRGRRLLQQELLAYAEDAGLLPSMGMERSQ